MRKKHVDFQKTIFKDVFCTIPYIIWTDEQTDTNKMTMFGSDYIVQERERERAACDYMGQTTICVLCVVLLR